MNQIVTNPQESLSNSLTNKIVHTRFFPENLKFVHKGLRDDRSEHAHRYGENQSADIYTHKKKSNLPGKPKEP